MTGRERRIAWTAAALVAAWGLALWFTPPFSLHLFPSRGLTIDGAPAPTPDAPFGAFVVSGLLLAFGIGAAWFLPWLGRRVRSAAARISLAIGCLAMVGLGLSGGLAFTLGVPMARDDASNLGALFALFGAAMLLWLIAGGLGLRAVVRTRPDAP